MTYRSLRARALERRRNRWFLAAAVLACAWAALLRFEALTATYGHLGQPRWVRPIEAPLLAAAARLRPSSIRWRPEATPYVGGDPINYLKYAREMRHFYQAHVREPMFLALTRAWLWLTGGRDIALSYASAFASTLAVLATCLLGAIVRSRPVGIAAGLALAVEFRTIAWSIEGWRDDTFMLFVTLAAAALLLLYEHPTRPAGVVAGLTSAAACLTRITACTFVVPALVFIALLAPRERRGQARAAAGLAALVAAALVAPYLVNTWRATGDPFYALNYHTRYYRSAEGQPLDESLGALDYVSGKLVSRPVTTIDTAAQGLISVPFLNKWNGWDRWHPVIGSVLKWSAAAGALMAAWSPRGRLLLLILLSSLLPYALTWSVGGGGEWRFTQHVYPIYLVLACGALAAAARFGAALARRDVQRPSRGTLLQVAATAGAVGLVAAAYAAAPLAIARESLAAEGLLMITAGNRDARFLEGPWSAPIRQGNVTVRMAQAPLTSLALPLEKADYLLTLRMDPPLTADPARQPSVTVFLNRRPLAQLDLTRDPARVGMYRIEVPREAVEPWSRLDLLASHTVPAAEAGAPFAELPPESPVAFRLWYVRLERR